MLFFSSIKTKLKARFRRKNKEKIYRGSFLKYTFDKFNRLAIHQNSSRAKNIEHSINNEKGQKINIIIWLYTALIMEKNTKKK